MYVSTRRSRRVARNKVCVQAATETNRFRLPAGHISSRQIYNYYDDNVLLDGVSGNFANKYRKVPRGLKFEFRKVTDIAGRPNAGPISRVIPPFRANFRKTRDSASENACEKLTNRPCRLFRAVGADLALAELARDRYHIAPSPHCGTMDKPRAKARI